MRDKIRQAPTCDNILSTLSFWAALQETRKACGKNRDELLDTWHTLLMPKIVSAMMTKDERERVRALKGLFTLGIHVVEIYPRYDWRY